MHGLVVVTVHAIFFGQGGRSNALSHLTLLWMHDEVLESGAPLNLLPARWTTRPLVGDLSEAEMQEELIHDSRQGFRGFFAKLWNREARTIDYMDGSEEALSREPLVLRMRRLEKQRAKVSTELPDGQLILGPLEYMH